MDCVMVSMALAMGVGVAAPYDGKSIADVPFVQECHEPYPIEPGGKGDDVRAVAVDASGRVWAATRGGVRILKDGAWERVAGVTEGQAFDLFADGETMWVAAWDGVYRVGPGRAGKVAQVTGPVGVVGGRPGDVLALGFEGSWRCTGGTWTELDVQWSRNLRDVAIGPDGTVWIATWMGLYSLRPEGVRRYFEPEDIYSGAVSGVAFAPDGRLWAGGWGGITVFENGACVAQIAGKEGLPHWDVHSMTFAPDGTLWAGTALGVARHNESPEWVARNNGSQWSLRHGKRWLLGDDVRDVAFDKDGTAWVATGAGVSAIKRRTMTLADKADYYQRVLRERHVREPGFVEKCYLPDPKDLSKWEPLDDDNDGEYTSLYLMTECLRYAVTGDAEARKCADEAYEALEFLQKVTGTDGFFARTVVPSTWEKMADMNEEYTAEGSADRQIWDPRWKPMGKRWRLSADGKWYWKGDTSSDEMNGHMMGYYFYHELVADGDRKERVARHMDRIMTHVIENDYALVDPEDGKPTRWGVWKPEKLNHDPDWWVEGHINAFEMLAYLRIAHHVTADEKYMREYDRFVNKHGYAERARRPKAHRRSEWSHIDDGMIAELAPCLMATETDPRLRAIYMEGITWSYRMVENDQNPFFNFSFGMIGGKNFHLEESVEFLRDQPLDLRHWRIDNSEREDIDLVRRPMQEPLQTSRMLPPSERGVMRWDKNPWAVVSGDSPDPEGRRESSGVFWLLPYWMGRYCGFIEAP